MKLRLMICAIAAGTALFADDTTSATFGMIRVNDNSHDTVIGVPWANVGTDGNVTLSNLVSTATLAENDKLYLYEGQTWYGYQLNGSGIWMPMTTISDITPSGVPDSAHSKRLARGAGLILQRGVTNNPVYLCGRLTNETVCATIAANGTTLFANPCATNVDINVTFAGATIGDTIMIPQDNGKSAIYTFDGKEWGSTNKVVTGTYQLGNKTYNTYANEWVRGGEIKAGTGAWYESKASNAHTITW